MLQKHRQLHAVAEQLGIIEEGEKRPIHTLVVLIDSEKQRLASAQVIHEVLQERQQLLYQAENVQLASNQALINMVDNLTFDACFGDPEPTSTTHKQTRLSIEEMDQLLKSNFFSFFSENPRLPLGRVTFVSKLIFARMSGQTGEGKHRSLTMLENMAIKKENEYKNMLKSDNSKAQESNTKEKQDSECVCVCVCFGCLCVPSPLFVVRLTILCPTVARYTCS